MKISFDGLVGVETWNRLGMVINGDGTGLESLNKNYYDILKKADYAKKYHVTGVPRWLQLKIAIEVKLNAMTVYDWVHLTSTACFFVNLPWLGVGIELLNIVRKVVFYDSYGAPQVMEDTLGLGAELAVGFVLNKETNKLFAILKGNKGKPLGDGKHSVVEVVDDAVSIIKKLGVAADETEYLLKALDKKLINPQKWTGKISGKIIEIMDDEFKFVDDWLSNSKNVYKIPGMPQISKTPDFFV